MTAEVNIPDEAVKLAAEQIRVAAAACCQEAALAANVAGSTEDWMGEAQAALKAAAPLIVAAELERLAKKFEGRARACKNLGFTQFSEGRADGLTVAKDELLRLVAELRGESR